MKNLMLLVFITLAACFTPIFAKITVAEVSPISLGFLRFGVAAVLFYVTLKIRKVKLSFDKKDYPMLMLLGILCIPLNQFSFLTGVKMSYASHSGIIYSLNPVFAYIVAVYRKTETFYPKKLAAILLTVLGIFFVFYEGLTETGMGLKVLVGDALLVGAVLTFSLYLSLGKELIDKYGALKVNTFVFLFGTLCFVPMFIFDVHNLDLSLITYKGIIGYLYLTVFVAYLTYFIWYYALKTIAISRLTTLGNLSPLLTVLFSIIFLSEHISVYFAIGGALTVLGVFIMHRVSIDLR
jgi:drug/metabolite transporter (DMT)-like permease